MFSDKTIPFGQNILGFLQAGHFIKIEYKIGSYGGRMLDTRKKAICRSREIFGERQGKEYRGL